MMKLTEQGISNMTAHTPDTRRQSQIWKLYVASIAWPLYLFTLPAVASQVGAGVIVWMIFPGIYLFCWLGVLMHETAHRYFDGVNNDRFYKLFSLMLCLDPQIFKVTHATHHKHVNNYDDRQIHPLGRIEKRNWRALYNISEVLLGDMHFWVFAPIGLWRDPQLRARYSWMKAVCWNLLWILGLLGVGAFSVWTFGVAPLQVALLYGISLWMSAVVLRHNEMVQHAHVIVDGPREERVMATRNLYPRGILARLFLFLTHNDPLQHVLHHTHPTQCSRWHPYSVPMPDGAVYITMFDYLRLLGRMMLGEEPTERGKDLGGGGYTDGMFDGEGSSRRVA